jgi:hypothetical protein
MRARDAISAVDLERRGEQKIVGQAGGTLTQAHPTTV